jgi:hypothetical protein
MQTKPDFSLPSTTWMGNDSHVVPFHSGLCHTDHILDEHFASSIPRDVACLILCWGSLGSYIRTENTLI